MTDKLSIKREILIDLLGELGEIESEFAEKFSYKDAFNRVVNYVNDQIIALDVARELVRTRKLTGKEDYEVIVEIASKLGVSYIGKKKVDLLTEINEKII